MKIAALVLASLAVLAGAEPLPAKLALCKGQKAGDTVQSDARKWKEEGKFFAFAKSLLGSPTRCEMTETEFDEQRFVTVKYLYAKGGTLVMSSLPPETSMQALTIPGGFTKEAAAREFLEGTAKDIGLHIGWAKEPETYKESGGGVRSSWWDPDEGLNAQAFMVRTTSGSLVSIGISMAL